jgi:hypothetical protein
MPQALPFTEAIQSLVQKNLLPTSMGSAEIRALDAGLRRQSLFSARTTITRYLDDIKATVESVINPKQVARVLEDGTTQMVTEGFNPATARQNLREQLRALGYQPSEREAGTIQDLASDARLNLVIKTNTEIAQGAGQFVQQNADAETVDAYPALELFRLEERKDPRDWAQRWRIAAQVAGDAKAAGVLEFTGRMVALKSSGIWQQLGDGAGGYEDTLGNPYPPFAFQSGMFTEEVSRDSAEELGLLDPGQPAQAARFDWATVFNPPMEVAA